MANTSLIFEYKNLDIYYEMEWIYEFMTFTMQILSF